MKYNKEFLYHFTCELCHNWWSYAAEADFNFIGKEWFCPHCGQEYNPPHFVDVVVGNGSND